MRSFAGEIDEGLLAGPVHLTLAYDYLQTEYGTTESDYRWDEGVSQGWFFGLVIRK